MLGIDSEGGYNVLFFYGILVRASGWLPVGGFYCGLGEMNWHELIQDGLELYVCVILTLEYLWGRSDTDIKNEVKRKKKAREKYNFENLTSGEGK